MYSNIKQNHRFFGVASILGASILLQLTTVANVVAQSTGGAVVNAHTAASRLTEAQSWGYQLQGVVPAKIAGSPYDVAVIDYSRDGTAAEAFSPADVTTMQQRPDGKRRIVLAYLSIGEAESYRFYWQAAWAKQPPAWLGAENPDWEGNYAVHYWDPAWQKLIFGGPSSYLDSIIAAGFDGVYLDRIDAFDVDQAGTTRATRMADMARFVHDLAAYARARVPQFLVVGQNGEELLDDATYSAAIDGMAKEDLFFGVDGDGVANALGDQRASLTPIQAFQRSGKPVFLVEYLTKPDQIAFARHQAGAMGAPLFIGGRELDDVQSR